MVDIDELLPWEVLPEGPSAQPSSAPTQSWPLQPGKKLPRLETPSPSESQESTPRGAGALFDFKELEHSTAPVGHSARGSRTVGTTSSQANVDHPVDLTEEDVGNWEKVELHPEGLRCLVVCTDWVSVFAAPREDGKRIGTLKEGSLVTVYEVRDNWARHKYDVKRGKAVSAWSTMFDSEETCLIRPLSELTDEERWIFGDFSALALPEPEADPQDAAAAAAPGAAERGAEEVPDQAEDLEAQQQDTDPPEDGPTSSAAEAPGDPPPPRAFELDQLLGLFGQQPDPQQPPDVQGHDRERSRAGTDADPDTVAFADIPSEGLQCVVVCRSWVPVRLAPTYWSKMIGGLKVGSHVTVYEVADVQWARHEFAMRDGVQIPAWSSVADPHHGKLIRPLANVSASDLERLERLRAGLGSSKATACESAEGPLAAHRLPAVAGGPLLLEVLGLGLAALGMVLHAGPAAARALRATSRDVGSSVAELVPVVQRWCPISLYVCGGYTSTQEDSSSGALAATASVERLHPVTGAWEALPRMLQRRAGAVAATVAGRVYVCGGSDGEVELRTAERFDPLGGAWEPIAHMLQRRECAAAAVVSKKLYVCGGSRSSLRGAMIEETAECFDPEADVWESVPSMLEKRVGAAAANLGGHLYVCGGMEGADDLRSVERLEPASLAPAWEVLPPMRHTRYSAAAASVAGKLYVCGGTVSAVAACTVECFDPATRIWKDSPQMLASRSCTAAASIAGRLYVVGGKAGRLCLDAAELFDPVARTWKAVAPMQQCRRGVAAAAAGGPLHLRFRPGAVDELSEEQQMVARMWEDYNRRAASHLRENAI